MGMERFTRPDAESAVAVSMRRINLRGAVNVIAQSRVLECMSTVPRDSPLEP